MLGRQLNCLEAKEISFKFILVLGENKCPQLETAMGSLTSSLQLYSKFPDHEWDDNVFSVRAVDVCFTLILENDGRRHEENVR